jgi:hypothetical protein
MLLLSDLTDATLLHLRELCDGGFLWGARLERLLPAIRLAVLADPAALQPFAFLLRKLLYTTEHSASYVMLDSDAASTAGSDSNVAATRLHYSTELRLIASIVL